MPQHEGSEARGQVRLAVAACQQDHDALLRSPVDIFDTAIGEHNWCIPSAGGALLTTARVAKMITRDNITDKIAYVAGETWLGLDQLWPEQDAQLQACRWSGPGPKLGTSLLLPPPLRPLVQVTAGLALLPDQIDRKQLLVYTT
nr:hypothetical protein [uncultured Lichenicoccus sp.]